MGLNKMLNESNLSITAVPASAGEPADEAGAAFLAWMEQLEASLLGSHRALLALDLAGIERGTCEQAALLRKLTAKKLIGKFGMVRRQSGDAVFHLPGHAVELGRELRRSGTRVLAAARLQSALLARAQTKLRVLANMLAGPSVDYGPLLARQAGGRRGWDRK
jgi:hypothetical protein